jgi:hypothetical protein
MFEFLQGWWVNRMVGKLTGRLGVAMIDVLYGFRFTNPYYFQPPSTSESEYVDELAGAD